MIEEILISQHKTWKVSYFYKIVAIRYKGRLKSEFLPDSKAFCFHLKYEIKIKMFTFFLTQTTFFELLMYTYIVTYPTFQE